jgi:predicted transcriptional regulator
METQPITQEMMRYFMQLNDAQQKSVLEMIKAFLVSRKNDKTSLEEYNTELEKADAEIEAGDYVPHEEVMKRYLK